MELNSKTVKKILLIIFLGSVLFTAVWRFETVAVIARYVLSVFSPVIAALCIAFVLNVLLTALEVHPFKFMGNSKKKFIRKAQRPLCLVLTYLIAFGIITLLIAFIIPDIIDTIIYLAEKLPVFANDARNWIEDVLKKFNVSDDLIPIAKINWTTLGASVKKYLSGYSEAIFGSAVDITTSFFSGVYTAVFSVLISVYVLAQKEKIGSFMRRLTDAFLSDKQSYTVRHIADRTYESFSRFIGGQLTESVILGMLFYIGMSIFRFPNAAVISIFICVTSLVPIVGATVGCVIGALLILITSPIKAVLFVVFFLVIQQIEGSLIYPKVVGKSVGIPGIMVVCAVLVGGNIGGIIGSLIAVPTAAVIYVLLKEVIAERLAAKRQINKSETAEKA